LSKAIVRPFLRGLVAALLPVVVVVALWWTLIAPSNTRDWTIDAATSGRLRRLVMLSGNGMGQCASARGRIRLARDAAV
jgi:hypothetical protein